MSPSESLETYLRSGFASEKREITRVREIVQQVISVFAEFHIQAAGRTQWNYVVSSESAPTSAPYSESTNAMILFTLAVVAGEVERSAMLPAIRVPFRIEISDRLNDVRKRAIESLAEQVRANGYRLHSGTFGENDPFTLSWILELLHAALARHATPTPQLGELQAKLEITARDIITRAVQNPGVSPLSWEEPRRQAVEHAFPLLRVIQLNELVATADKPLTRVHRYFLDRLHRNLSYSSIVDSPFDAADLAFSLEGALLSDPDTVDEGTVRKTFDVISERQTHHPYWRPMLPFVAMRQGLTLLPLSVEIANSLLRSCRILTRQLGVSYFSDYIDLFKRYTQWLSARLVRGKDPSGRPFAGWHSEHIELPGTIHLWEVSQVLLYLVHYASMMQEHVARRSIELVGFSVDRAPRPLSWRQFVADSEPTLGLDESSQYCVFGQIEKHFLSPVVADRSRSMLLYGPPGTGKTTIARKLADALNFNFISITPSDFIARGEAEVEARAKSIFEVLREQSNVVLLFDEIDRLILDRDSHLYQQQSDIFQFMTPGMLTKLADLRAQAPVFIIATNYDERIDPAIKRSGRIDNRFLVLPPSFRRRQTVLHDFLPGIGAREIETAAKLTPLFVRAELETLTRAVRQSATNSAQQSELLIGRLKEGLQPAIKLVAYQSRFRAHALKGQSFPTAQEPHEEFLLLVYLVLECRKLTSAELTIAGPVLRETNIDQVILDRRVKEVLKKLQSEVKA
jgi:ATPase family protein associated with various cellular activities (AAA)